LGSVEIRLNHPFPIESNAGTWDKDHGHLQQLRLPCPASNRFHLNRALGLLQTCGGGGV
jgi:hypothetical protein